MKSLSYGGLFTSKELFIPESPHLTCFSKAHKCSNKTVNRSNDPLTRRAHAEWGKNYEILLLATRFDTKVKCPTGRASFWVKLRTVRSKTPVKCPEYGDGRFWN